MEIVWLRKAEQNLSAIYTFIAKEAGSDRAGRVIERVIEAAERLGAFPHLGKQSESDPDIRELQVTALPFLLPYRVARGRVEILRVFHEAQERPDHLER
jgi:toxin ParE1/3/4